MCVTRYRALVLFVSAAAWLLGGVVGGSASKSWGAAAKQKGQPISAYSASLFGKTNLSATQQQVLACDPDEPIAGSTSVQYNPNIVRVTGFEFGPGYMRNNNAPTFFPSGAAIEVAAAGNVQLRDLGQYLSGPPGQETGYLQLFYQENGDTKGKFGQPPETVLLQTDGPISVDTHRYFFEYRFMPPNNPDPAATYRVYADPGTRPSGNTPDFMMGLDGTLSTANEIQSAQVAGTVGDMNHDGAINATDLDLLCERINSPTGPISPFDVNGDGLVSKADLNLEVTGILGTHFGDTDTDGDVDLPDLGNLASGFGLAGEKRWSRGNFDCDDDVDLPDLGVLASNFDGGRRAALEHFEALVPEPSVLPLIGASVIVGLTRRRRIA